MLFRSGLSSRFGSPKALATIADTPAIAFLLKKLCASQVAEIIIVLGAESALIELSIFKHKIIRVAHNNDYKLGRTSSVQTGLRAASATARGFMLLPVDCPFVSMRTIDRLIERFMNAQPMLLIPTHQGRKGHPPIFRSDVKNDILKLKSSQGLNEITNNPVYMAETLELPDFGITQTFNTPDELARILRSKDFNLT